jgi:hypothetical protein
MPSDGRDGHDRQLHAALSKVRAADATRSKNHGSADCWSFFTFEMPDVHDVSHRGVTVTTAVTIMLLAIVTVGAVTWHGHGRWY